MGDTANQVGVELLFVFDLIDSKQFSLKVAINVGNKVHKVHRLKQIKMAGK
jgi:hypothetical protein